jgi:hypothetical protein
MTVSTLPSILKKMEISGWKDCHLCKRWKFPSYKWQNAIQDASSFYVNNGTTYSCTVRTYVRCALCAAAQRAAVQQYSSCCAAAVQPYTTAVKLNGRARARAGSQSGAESTARDYISAYGVLFPPYCIAWQPRARAWIAVRRRSTASHAKRARDFYPI